MTSRGYMVLEWDSVANTWAGEDHWTAAYVFREIAIQSTAAWALCCLGRCWLNCE